MRILITTDTVGGVWSFTETLCAGLLARGHQVFLVSLGREPADAQQDWVRSVESEYSPSFFFRFLDTPLEWMRSNARAYPGAASELLRIIAEQAIEVFHGNQFCFGALPLGIPKIITAHSDVFSWAQACRRDGALEPSPWLDTYRELVGNGIRHADELVAPTAWMLEALRPNYKLPKMCRVIPNGVSSTCLRERSGSQGRRLQAVTAGRLWDQGKGVALLARVQSSIPLIAAGQLRNEDDGSCVGDLGDVVIAGPLSRAELHALFSRSMLYVCTSVYEPFGLAPLEAALCGCAILSRDTPSMREVWADAACYFSTAKELSELLTVLSADRDRLEHLRHRSAERAALYSAERMTTAYEDAYQQLTAQTYAA